MRFGNIIYSKRNERLTIGDDIQILAIENLYKMLDIPYETVVRIPLNELSTYNGDYVLLPISFPFISYNSTFDIFDFSPKIIPVFLGLCLITSNLSQKDVDYLMRFSPIGCRDIHTLETMRKYNIPAFLNTCMSLSFPKVVKKEDLKKRSKVYVIDCSEDLKKAIPTSIQENCEYLSHTYYTKEINTAYDEFAKERYSDYIQNARLIITDRLHAAIPCSAAGLPVIFAKDEFSYRFAGIDNILKVYTKEEYDEINWDPEPYDFEELKLMQIENAKQRIFDTYNKYQNMCNLSSCFENRQRGEWYMEFVTNTIRFIDKTWDHRKKIHYSVWGVTQVADQIIQYISENYPCAILDYVIDNYKKGFFWNKESVPSEIICNDGFQSFVFVSTAAAIPDSYSIFHKRNYTMFYQCCEDGNKHNLDKMFE